MVRRRQGQQNENVQVHGPQSALTSFLRGAGIESRPRQQQQQPAPVASTSTAPAPPTPAAEPVAGPSTPPTNGKKRKKGKKGDDDEGFEFEFGPDHKARYADRKPGSICMCAECNKKFTVTKYTKSLPNGAGMLCLPCEKELGGGLADAAKPPVKKRKTAQSKSTPIEKIKNELPTLQESCIKIIGQCIEDLEEDTLGDVGPANMEKICKIVCKNRALTPQTLKLFLDIGQQELRLFDCSRIDDRGYLTLCNLAPNLRSLSLRYCGTIDDGVMDLIQTKLVHLQRLELYGPFLVRADKWKSYFDSLVGRDFEAFRLQQCPRFDMSCLERLVENVPGLVDLQIADLVKLDNDGLKHVRTLSQLKHLDIGRAGKDGKALKDDAVISLLTAVGEKLESLVLDLNEALTDRTLIEGIMPNCRNLQRLSMRLLSEVLSKGVETLFKGFDENPPLRELSLHRIIDVDDEALAALLVHSGPALRVLDLNSCDNITDSGLDLLATTATRLEMLDISFVRATDDFKLKAILDGIPNLKVLSVYGDNRVTGAWARWLRNTRTGRRVQAGAVDMRTAMYLVVHSRRIACFRRLPRQVLLNFRRRILYGENYRCAMSTQAQAPEALPHLHEPLGTSRRKLRVVVIGAGIAGLNAAKKWGQADGIDLQVYERDEAIGGVWQKSQYSGLKCDIPSHVFQYSWAPNPRWSKFYAERDEIIQYLNDTADKHDLRRFVKLRHDCVGAFWDEERSQWRLKIQRQTADGTAAIDGTAEQNGTAEVFDDVCDVLLLAWGHLNHFKWPSISGLDKFKGKLMHSARWDRQYDLTGKRVACIGNGASAVQIVPAIHSQLKSLDIYMRTPTWVPPHPFPDGQTNKEYTSEEIARFEQDPQFYFQSRKQQEHEFHARQSTLRQGSALQSTIRSALEKQYSELFKDNDELRKKIQPNFAFGCRRPTPGLPFLKTMLEKNVRVITEPIEEATFAGLKTAKEETEYDVVICSTGYDTTHKPRLPIVGRNGVDLAELWTEYPELYLGATVHGFPNMAFMVGLGTPTGNHYNAVELSARYVGLLISRLQNRLLLSWDVTKEAQDDWNEYYQARMKTMVFTDSCISWYKTDKGRVYLPYPGTVPHYARATATLQDDDYVWKRSARNRFDWLGDGQLPAEAAADLSGVDLTPFLGSKAGVPIDEVPVIPY